MFQTYNFLALNCQCALIYQNLQASDNPLYLLIYFQVLDLNEYTHSCGGVQEQELFDIRRI